MTLQMGSVRLIVSASDSHLGCAHRDGDRREGRFRHSIGIIRCNRLSMTGGGRGGRGSQDTDGQCES